MIDLTSLKDILDENYQIDCSKFNYKTRVSDLGLDSLDQAELLVHIEERYKITLDDFPLGVTLGDIVDYINSKVN